MADVNMFPEEGKKPPPPKPHDMPPHLFKELIHMAEKLGKLEGMMEVMMRQQHSCHCGNHNPHEK